MYRDLVERALKTNDALASESAVRALRRRGGIQTSEEYRQMLSLALRGHSTAVALALPESIAREDPAT